MNGLGMPFQPRSFRDCSLYEQHWIQSSRGYARRFLPSGTPFRAPRDTQRQEMSTGLGPEKCKHFRSPMSDEIVDAQDVLPRIEQLSALVEINGERVATTSTAGMLHDWAHTLSFLSTEEPLYPGELIATGTLPFGCGMENGRWLQPGDTLRLAIEGVGEIRHTVLA